ncbi:MAG: hypothetical protein C0602_04910 [Denitrovibrio sp.]|nr:MAG: hypothetical protein C0602_04910 [Denitrovibrio sp.]
MDYTKLDTGAINFAGWTVELSFGKGTVSDMVGNKVAHFDVEQDGNIQLKDGEKKFKDLALIAIRSFVRYGTAQTV